MDELERLHAQLARLADELIDVRLSPTGADARWRPAINLYGCPDRFVICVDLAGVDKQTVSVRVERRRVLLSGHRPPPEPASEVCAVTQVLAMEIDHGPFEREILLPADLDPERATAEQRDGLLWIDLPLQTQA